MLVVSSLALSLLLPGRELQQATIQVTAKPLEAALPEIGKAFGAKLSASPSTAKDVIVLAVKDASLKAVMDHISTTFEASWRESEGGYMLVRTADQVREQRKRELSMRAKSISKALEQKKQELAKLAAWNDKEADKLIKDYQATIRTFNPNDQRSNFWQKSSELQKRSPLARALTQLLLLFDAYDLAQVEPETTVVWSSQPTRYQRQLPQRAIQAISRAVDEEKRWRQRVAARWAFTSVRLAPLRWTDTTVDARALSVLKTSFAFLDNSASTRSSLDAGKSRVTGRVAC